jgi:large repetitive protein
MVKWMMKAVPVLILVAAGVVVPATVASASGSTASMTDLTSSPSTVYVGTPVVFTATVTNAVTSNAADPTQTVIFTDNGNAISCTGNGDGTLVGTAPINTSATAVAQCHTTFTAPESGHTITATYEGDSNYASSAGTISSFAVNAATTALAIGDAPTSGVVTGQTVTYTATLSITAGAGTPTGTVTFKDENASPVTTLCSAVPLGAGLTATCGVVDGLPAPADPTPAVEAFYTPGNSNFGQSNSSSLAAPTTSADNTTILISPEQGNPVMTGQSVTFQATVLASAPGGGTPGGTVSFTLTHAGGASCATATLVSGSATCTVSAGDVTAGSTPIGVMATYSGSTLYNGNSATFNENVSLGSDNLGVIVTPKKPALGGPVTLTIVVVPVAPASGSPTGEVSFLITAKGAPPLVCSGSSNNLVALTSSQATCTISSIPESVKKLKVSVTYFGDSNFQAASAGKRVKL